MKKVLSRRKVFFTQQLGLNCAERKDFQFFLSLSPTQTYERERGMRMGEGLKKYLFKL
jgi:hypothetical protein